MLKALLLSLMNLALAAMATAQNNLVPNPGFEDTVDCDVSTQCTLLKAMHWYNPTLSTPDVWDCDLDRLCGMGMSDDGGTNLSYQYAHEGTRHAGIYMWFGPGSSNTREYLGTRLSAPLVAGQSYEVACYYSRCRNYQYAVDHIGAWLGQDSLWQNTTWWLAQSPQARLVDANAEYLVEGEEWVRVSDTIMASGGEQWLALGNFDMADSVNGILAEPGGVNEPAYYYVDLVSVVAVGEVMGIHPPGLLAYWSAGGLTILWPGGFKPLSVEVYDICGRLVIGKAAGLAGSQTELDLRAQANGTYLVRVSSGHDQLVAKFIKEEGGF